LQAGQLQAVLNWLYQLLDVLEAAYEQPASPNVADWAERLQAAVDAQYTFWPPLRRVLLVWLVIALWWFFLDWLLFADRVTP
jgi:hypothetical protein